MKYAVRNLSGISALAVAGTLLSGAGHADTGCAVPASLAEGEVHYCYDALGRLVSVHYAEDEQVTYSYDAAGNRIEVMANGDGTPPGEAAVYITLPLNGFTVIPVIPQ